MTDQAPLFIHTLLEWRLQERLADALKTISTLPREDVLRCDSECLTEIIRQFAVSPPILRLDSIVADEEIGEAEDIITGRKIGHTNHSYFIPIEREPVWLEDVANQRITDDGYPLAFLEEKYARISIRLSVSPEDEEGELQRKLDVRRNLVAQYADSVAAKIVEFNKELAEKMATDLHRRKNAITKGMTEQEKLKFPQVYNPMREETAKQIERIV